LSVVHRHQEVEIAVLRIEPLSSCRAEEVEALDAKTAAKRRECGAAFFDERVHTTLPLQARSRSI
jgi:hypothetical protein